MVFGKIRAFLAFSVLAAAIGVAGPAAATLYDKQWDPGLYGSLDQHDTDCANVSCGPTAAVNSFVFLQNMYPHIYGTSLAGSTYQDWIDTANTLLDPAYMNCNCGGGGTSIGDFISGKIAYLDDVAPGTTEVHFQNFFDANNSVIPTWQFLYEELVKGQDIELLIGFYDENGRQGGHYVTVTGINFDDVNDNMIIDGEDATLYYVDPDDGMAHSVTLDMLNNFLVMTGYIDGFTTYVEAAVAESPIPVPAMILIFGLGVVGVAIVRRRR